MTYIHVQLISIYFGQFSFFFSWVSRLHLHAMFRTCSLEQETVKNLAIPEMLKCTQREYTKLYHSQILVFLTKVKSMTFHLFICPTQNYRHRNIVCFVCKNTFMNLFQNYGFFWHYLGKNSDHLYIWGMWSNLSRTKFEPVHQKAFFFSA